VQVKTLGVKPTKSAQMQGRLSLLTFFGEAKKVSAARHERNHAN
jgi:hypothetical protein